LTFTDDKAFHILLLLSDHMLFILADWMPNRDFMVDWPERQEKAFEPGLSRLKRDVWYAYITIQDHGECDRLGAK